MSKSGDNKIAKSKAKFLNLLKQNDLVIINDYIDTQHKVNLKCNICNNTWSVRPNAFSGQCKFCKSKQTALNRFNESHPRI